MRKSVRKIKLQEDILIEINDYRKLENVKEILASNLEWLWNRALRM